MSDFKKALDQLQRGTSLPMRVFRFVGVGLFASFAYFAAVAFYVEIFRASPSWASLLGYLTATPLSYFGHRRVTFRSNGNMKAEFFRFLSLHAINILVSVSGMYVITVWWSMSYFIGSGFAMIVVPISTFLVMNVWVFVEGTQDARH